MALEVNVTKGREPGTIPAPEQRIQAANSTPQGSNPSENAIKGERQWIRYCRLTVEGSGGSLDLSNMRVRFQTHQQTTQQPNWTEVWITNLADKTEKALMKGGEFKKLTLEAGYQDNHGILVSGEITQASRGRESPTDTYIRLVARDGDRAHNSATVNKTLAAGHTFRDQVDVALKALAPFGVTAGYIADLGNRRMPRARVMFGMARDLLRTISQSTNTSWSIQNGRLDIVPNNGVKPGGPIILNSQSGLIGRPTETLGGLEVRCLLNPQIAPNTLIQIDQSKVNELQFGGEHRAAASETLTDLVRSTDGRYKVHLVEHEGDVRGNPWYSNLTCIKANGDIPPALAQRGIITP